MLCETILGRGNNNVVEPLFSESEVLGTKGGDLESLLLEIECASEIPNVLCYTHLKDLVVGCVSFRSYLQSRSGDVLEVQRSTDTDGEI